MNKELCWMLLPITALLSQLGGTYWKALRRYFIPIISLIVLWIFLKEVRYSFIFMSLHLYLGYCLPVTKFGDSIPSDWRNWIWLPIWSIILCSSILWVDISYYIISIICGILLSSLVILSNLKCTEKYFQWKFVEMFEGIFPLIPMCCLITLS